MGINKQQDEGVKREKERDTGNEGEGAGGGDNRRDGCVKRRDKGDKNKNTSFTCLPHQTPHTAQNSVSSPFPRQRA